MKTRIMYVELKSHSDGHNDNGPAWITRIIFSKSGKSIYFHGKLLKRGSSGCSNYYDSETDEEYWVSGPKKDGTDRYPWAHNKVFIEEDVREEYWQKIRNIPSNVKQLHT